MGFPPHQVAPLFLGLRLLGLIGLGAAPQGFLRPDLRDSEARREREGERERERPKLHV